MTIKRLVRPGTPIEVSVLAAMVLVLAAGCCASALFPMVQETPRGLLVAFGLSAVVLALALLLVGERLTPASLHVGVVLLVALHAAMTAVAATERGLMLGALGFVWTAVYVAYFFAADTARAYAALMTAALGASLLVARAPTDVRVWITLSAMIWVAITILTRLNARLRAEAQSDGLTGLLNRTGFAVTAARQRAIAARRGLPVALAVIDLDEFKVVNDRDGHAAGDRLLVELASAWSASLRPEDVVARFGGDEFVLLLPGVGEDKVDDVLARLRRAHPAPWTAGAIVCSDGESLDAAVDRADRRLYGAKELRRRPDQTADQVFSVMNASTILASSGPESSWRK